MKKKPTRGGAREGAGRKPRATPLEAITVRVEPAIAAKFRIYCRLNNRSQSAQFSAWVKRE